MKSKNMILQETYQKNELVRIAKFLQLKNARYNNKTEWIECNDRVMSIVNSFKHKVLDSEVADGQYDGSFYILSQSLGNIYSVQKYSYSGSGKKSDTDRSILELLNKNKIDSSKIETIRNKLKFKPLGMTKSIKEGTYSFGTKEYASKNLTLDEILDIAMAYHKENPKKIIGKKNDHNIKVANDLATLLGSTQLEPSKRTGKPILVAGLLKNGLVTKEEYISLFKDLTDKHKIVARVLSGAKADTRGASKAARVATKDMKGEFGDTDESVKLNEDSREEIRKYKGIPYEIWFTPRKSTYYAIGKGKGAGKIKLRQFDTDEEAIEHAENEIEGFLDEGVLESKIKYAKTVTKSQWNKAHKDYKTIIDGEYYMMVNDPKHGTILAPVQITNETVCEECDDEEKINESPDNPIINQLRDVIENGYKTLRDPKSGKKMKVDSYTASAIITVYDALKNPTNKEKFSNVGLLAMQNIAFKILNKK